MLTAFAGKILVVGTNATKVAAGRSEVNYGKKRPTISFEVIHEQLIVLIELKCSDLRQ